VTAAMLTLPLAPALADQRWLACRYTDARGAVQNFHMAFDDIRGTAALLDAGSLVEGSNTTINFQSLRTRFPSFSVTYNRNDGALSIAPPGGGMLIGDCRRSAPPPTAPRR